MHDEVTIGRSGDDWRHARCSCGRHLGARRTAADAVALWQDHLDAIDAEDARRQPQLVFEVAFDPAEPIDLA